MIELVAMALNGANVLISLVAANVRFDFEQACQGSNAGDCRNARMVKARRLAKVCTLRCTV